MSIEAEKGSGNINVNNNESVPIMGSNPNPTDVQKSKEEQAIWEIEVWKRAQMTQFKSYLKQLEFEFISKIKDDMEKKEDQREKEFKSKINELNILQNKLRKKASELESRENKITLCEEELKLKINEVSRQLINKDDEIAYIKKRFKDEKMQLEKEKSGLNKKLIDQQKNYENLEATYMNYKKEVEDSPLSLLKNEITRKQIQNEELTKEKNRLLEQLEKSNQVNDKLKNDLIKMKKAFDAEKEAMYKQRVDEVEKIKFEIYNQKMSQNDMNELKELREKMKNSMQNNDQNGTTMKVSINNNTMQPMASQSLRKEFKILTINKRTKLNEGDIRNEIDKLTKERNMLLSSKMYEENDPLIVQYDIKLRKLLQSSAQYQ